MRKLFIVFFIFLVAGSSSSASMVKENLSRFVICRLGKTIRTIRVSENETKDGCITTYTKGGQDRQVGNGMHWQSCLDILQNIQINLEKASWKCREIEKASVSSPLEEEDLNADTKESSH